MLGFKPAGDDFQFRERAVDRLAGFDSSNDVEVTARAVSHLAGTSRERCPYFGIAWKLEVRRHHCDYRGASFKAIIGSPHNRRIASEAAHPQSVTENDGVGRATLRVFRGEAAADQRFDSKGLKEIE